MESKEDVLEELRKTMDYATEGMEALNELRGRADLSKAQTSMFEIIETINTGAGSSASVLTNYVNGNPGADLDKVMAIDMVLARLAVQLSETMISMVDMMESFVVLTEGINEDVAQVLAVTIVTDERPPGAAPNGNGAHH